MKASGKKILVLGDVMLDEYLIGDYTRNSPEAAVPVIHYNRVDKRLGGAANVAYNLKSLGLVPTLLSIVGEDADGEALKQLCDKDEISTNFIKVPGRRTTKKQRVVDGDFMQYLRIDFEETDYISDLVEKELLSSVATQILNSSIDGLVLQDYNKGLLSPSLIQAVIQLAHQNSIPTFADPKHLNFELLAQATVFKPNLKELSVYSGATLGADEKNLTHLMESLTLSFGEMLFVTLAENGIYYKDCKQFSEGRIEGHQVPNPDVSGAGDSVLAALVLAYFQSPNAAYMAEIANRAGAAVCAKKGVSRVTSNEIKP